MIRILSVLLLMQFVASTAFAADLIEGIGAYGKGDYASALKEWKPLAEQGNSTAQNMLGHMYDLGKGVPQDYVYAHMWFNIASSSGDKNAAKLAAQNRDLVAVKMSPSDISEAQKLARQCVKKSYKGC